MKEVDPTGKLSVMIAGHLHPPVGGISAYFATLLNSSLPQQVELHFVQTTSPKRPFNQAGKFTFSNLVTALTDCWRFSQAVFSIRPQIVHIATAFGWSFLKHSLCVLIAKIAGCRVLLHPHCSFAAMYSNHSSIWKAIFRLLIRLPNAVLILSSEWKKLREICPSCKTYLLPNAIDLKPYLPLARNRFNQPNHSSPTQILFLGHIGKAKGSFVLVETAKILKEKGEDFFIHLVGSELTKGEIVSLQKMIEEFNLEDVIQIHPPAFGEQKLGFFRHADVFAYPSFHEGIPLAVIEAMACGLPVVATRVGGLPDLIQEGINGFLVPPGQPDALADKIAILIRDDNLRQKMQKESYRLAEGQFEIEQYVDQLVNIYRALL
ncbi:MAG: glycosyltransferase family 4 protein [Chloroflexota bacterium]